MTSNVIYQISKNDLEEMFISFLEKREAEAKAEAANEERLLDSGEVETMLKVDKTTLWRWGKREYLVPLKLGGKNRYRFSDVKRIMEGR